METQLLTYDYDFAYNGLALVFPRMTSPIKLYAYFSFFIQPLLSSTKRFSELL